MKKLLYIYLIAGVLLIVSCSKSVMDEVNRDRNDAPNVQAINELPNVEVETAFGTTGTDLAWYASVYIEHNAGTFGQLKDADKRTGASASSLFNNSWNSVYDNLMVLNDIIVKCSPEGPEPNNRVTLGIAQLLTAYNLAVTTDVFGQVPWTDALKGTAVMQPKFDKQQDIYETVLFNLLNSAISNLAAPVPTDIKSQLATQDLIYGGDTKLWTKAAWSLKARYFMHLQKITATAVDSVLACIPLGFTSGADALLFTKYDASGSSTLNANPWYQFLYDRGYLSVGKTLYDIMLAHNDPRISTYFYDYDANGVKPAPNGTAEDSQQGSLYSISALSDNPGAPTPMMTYHELLFLKAEAMARKGQDFTSTLKDAVVANFEYHGVDGGADYFDAEVAPKLNTPANALTELLTQKYIAFYESESIETYNDYRRTGVPQLNNPQNVNPNYGFVVRYAYPTSEVANNGKNVPQVSVFKNKVWWAGGTE